MRIRTLKTYDDQTAEDRALREEMEFVALAEEHDDDNFHRFLRADPMELMYASLEQFDDLPETAQEADR